MHALLIVDAQNEFSPRGQRAVPYHASALAAITRWVAHARSAGWPIAWVQHHNRPHESKAFVPGSWGAELSPELDPRLDAEDETLFQKDVYGAFTTTQLEAWLRARGVTDVVIVGFYAHMCLSTSVREALVRGFEVVVDPDATGARDLEHDALGRQTANEVRRSALLQLVNMGATIAATPNSGASDAAPEEEEDDHRRGHGEGEDHDRGLHRRRPLPAGAPHAGHRGHDDHEYEQPD